MASWQAVETAPPRLLVRMERRSSMSSVERRLETIEEGNEGSILHSHDYGYNNNNNHTTSKPLINNQISNSKTGSKHPLVAR